MSHKNVLQECPTSVLQECQECPARVSHESVLQEFLTRESHKSVLQECSARVFHKSAQECPTRESYKSVPQECPTRIFCKSVSQESVSYKVSHKSAQECPTKLSEKMCPTRVSRKSVSYKSVKNCSGVCFRARVCIRVRGFHLFFFCWVEGEVLSFRSTTFTFYVRVGESKLQTTEKSPNSSCVCSTKALSRALQRTRWEEMVITRRQRKSRRQIVSPRRLRFHRLKLGIDSSFVPFVRNTLLTWIGGRGMGCTLLEQGKALQ